MPISAMRRLFSSMRRWRSSSKSFSIVLEASTVRGSVWRATPRPAERGRGSESPGAHAHRPSRESRLGGE